MKRFTASIFALSALASTSVFAKDLSISITNLTPGIYFTPLLVAAHESGNRLYSEGDTASSSLQALAEGGDYSGLSADIQATGGQVKEDPAQGLMAPGAKTSFSFTTNDSNNRLSLAAMLLPTNDGFVGANSILIPDTAGTYTYYLNAYDAGTEANNEIVNGAGTPGELGIPTDPGGNAGTGATGMTTSETNTKIHIHRGNLGDMNTSGGKSDLNSSSHRWLNPVAQLVITVN